MKQPNPIHGRSTLKFLLCLTLIWPLTFYSPPGNIMAQTETPSAPPAVAPPPASTRSAAARAAAAAAASTNNTSTPSPASTLSAAPIPSIPSGPPPDMDKLSPTEDLQLSFQGANIDMIVTWLAKMTGKSVVKHPRVQCQLTIVSSAKIPPRDAINLVYRALSLEGFVAIESSKSILIVPEGQEPKMSPELVDATKNEVPEGRQKLVKIFQLKSIQAAELRDKIRNLVSEKASMEVNDRANQLIVTDYNDNIRLIGEMIQQLDVVAGGDSVVEFFNLKHSEAEEVGNLLMLVLNAQSPPPSSKSSSSSSGPSSSSRSSLPPGMDGSTPGSSPSPSSGPSGPAAPQFRVWPDRVSNRLIVAAPKAKLGEVQKLIDMLDTEKPQDVTLRIIQLKNVTADNLARQLGPLYQKMSGKSLKDTIDLTADTRANRLIVLSSEANFNAIEKLMATMDTSDALEKTIQTFPLKNADAQDVAKQLSDLDKDSDNSSRYPYYIISYSSGGNGNSAKKTSVVADQRRNTVIVQAPPSAMDGIAKMIAELDEPVTDNSLAPKIYRLKYVSATDIEEVLNQLFLKKPVQRSYYDYDYPFSSQSDDSGDKKGGKLYGKVRIVSEPYSNAIILTSNSAENLAAVEQVLKDLDTPSQAGETTLRVSLNFARAQVVANDVNILFAKVGSPPMRPVNQQQQQPDNRNQQQQQTTTSQNSFSLEPETKDDGYFPWLGGQPENSRSSDGRTTVRPVSDLVGRVRVVPDRRSNALLITCNVHFFPEVLKLINELDAPTPQVLIEAKIIEVSSDFRDKLGIRWSPDGATAFAGDDLDNSVKLSGNGAYKNVFSGSELANALHSGVLNSSVNLDVLVQFLHKNTDSKVLAEPQINISDNEIGKLFVGSQVPFISGSLNTDVGGRNDTFQYRDVGIILEVTPHINNSEEVALKIRTESSSIRAGETLFGGAIIDTRNFKTDLIVKNGEIIVLGGIIQREQSDTLRKTPGLGDIPGLGWAFKKRDKVTREVELMVFLRPKVVRSVAQARELQEEIDRKAPLIRAWKDEGQLGDQPKLPPPAEEKK